MKKASTTSSVTRSGSMTKRSITGTSGGASLKPLSDTNAKVEKPGLSKAMAGPTGKVSARPPVSSSMRAPTSTATRPSQPIRGTTVTKKPESAPHKLFDAPGSNSGIPKKAAAETTETKLPVKKEFLAELEDDVNTPRVSSTEATSSEASPEKQPPQEEKPSTPRKTTTPRGNKPEVEPRVQTPVQQQQQSREAPKKAAASPVAPSPPKAKEPSGTTGRAKQQMDQQIASGPWPQPSPKQTDLLTSPPGTMEKAFDGQYVYEFPDTGYFACLKCKQPIARASSKERIEGGYATFSRYCTQNLKCEMRIGKEDTVFVVECAGCGSNLGSLIKHPSSSTGDALRLNSLCVHLVIRSPPSALAADSTFDAPQPSPAKKKSAASSPSKAALPAGLDQSVLDAMMAQQALLDEEADEEAGFVDFDDKALFGLDNDE